MPAVLSQAARDASLSERSEQMDTVRAVLSSASDDGVGGYERAMREQLQK